MEKLNMLINDLSSIVSINDDQKKNLIKRYESTPDKDVAKDLLKKAYGIFYNDDEKMNNVIDAIRRYYPGLQYDNDKVKTILKKAFENEIEGNMSLEENHKLVKSSLVKFCNLFNKYGIDYYIVGALPCFLKTNQELFRYHDDIDIMINENQISQIAQIIESQGYEFHDDRYPSIIRYKEMMKNKPPHTVLAQNPDNEFHLGFFCFKREQNDSITVREYSHRMEDGRVITDLLERRSTPEGTKLRYDETPVQYGDTSFKTGTVESVYALKMYTRRPKDITDIHKLDPYMDKGLLEKLKQEPLEQVYIYDIEKEKDNGNNLNIN